MFDIGSRIVNLRKLHNISANKLSKELNVDPSTINKIEKGIRNPSEKVLFLLADVLVAENLFTVAGRLIPPEMKVKQQHHDWAAIFNIDGNSPFADIFIKLLCLYTNDLTDDEIESLKDTNNTNLCFNENYILGKIHALQDIYKELLLASIDDRRCIFIDLARVSEHDKAKYELLSEFWHYIRGSSNACHHLS